MDADSRTVSGRGRKMNDYISRQAAIEKILKDPVGKTLAHSYNLIGFIEGLPTADVRENVRGNWIGIDDEPCETFECDKCGFVLDDWIQVALYNFCPNCGADMRRKDAPGD